MGNLSNYNGWSGADRSKADRRFKAAVAKGLYQDRAKPGPCCMCGEPRNTMQHCEEYGPAVDDYVKHMYDVCAWCHGMIHLRFQFPGLWELHKRKIRDGEPIPFIPHIGVIFRSCATWTDYPADITTPPSDAWWEHLSMERYTGPMKQLSAMPEGVKLQGGLW